MSIQDKIFIAASGVVVTCLIIIVCTQKPKAEEIITFV